MEYLHGSPNNHSLNDRSYHSLSDHSLSKELHWQAYRQLELIPTAVQVAKPSFTFGLGRLWSGFLGLLVDELVDEQQVDYLKRCWESDQQDPPKTLQRLWTLME